MTLPVLHIGQPKTGSTAVQRFLRNNRKQLWEKGYFYPNHRVDSNGISAGHREFFKLFMSPRGLGVIGQLYWLLQRLKGHGLLYCWKLVAKLCRKRLVLSSEIMAFRPEQTHRYFNQAKVIAFFRAPGSALFSRYNQSVKRAGKTHSFEQFLSMQSSAKRDLSKLTGESLGAWLKFSPQLHLTVIPYARESFPCESIEFAFLNALQIPKPQWQDFIITERPVNNSLPFEALELKRALNLLIPHSPSSLTGRMETHLQALADANVLSSSKAIKQNGSLDTDLVEQLQSRMAVFFKRTELLSDEELALLSEKKDGCGCHATEGKQQFNPMLEFLQRHAANDFTPMVTLLVHNKDLLIKEGVDECLLNAVQAYDA